MANWIIPCNPKYYNVQAAFANLKCIDWKQSATSIEVGDTVYIYVARPVMAIKYKCKARKVLLPNIEINDSPYVIDGSAYQKAKHHMELELVAEYYDELTLDVLKNNGITSNIQGPRRMPVELIDYIKNNNL